MRRERLMHANDRTFAASWTSSIIVSSAFSIGLGPRPSRRKALTVRATTDFRAMSRAPIGLAMPSLRNRDAVNDHAKLFYSGLLCRSVRNADGLAAILTGFFRVTVRVEQFVGHWLALVTEDRTRLGIVATATLGGGAMLGGRYGTVSTSFDFALGRSRLRNTRASCRAALRSKRSWRG